MSIGPCDSDEFPPKKMNISNRSMSSTNEQSLAQAVLQDLNDNHSDSDEELPALVEVPLPVAASGASKRKKKSKSKKASTDEVKPAEVAADSEERSRMGELITLTMKKLELQQALPPFGEVEVAKEQRRIEAAKKASELALATVLESLDAPDAKIAKLAELMRASITRVSSAELEAVDWHRKEALVLDEKNLVFEQMQKSRKRQDTLESLARLRESQLAAEKAEHEAARAKLSADFQASLKKFSEQLDQYAAGVGQRETENATLREKIVQLLKLDSIRDEQAKHEAKKTELEKLIYEEKLKEQMSISVIEAKKCVEANKHAGDLLAANTALTQQLSEWQTRFQSLSDGMQQYSNLAAQYKEDSQQWSNELKKLQKLNKSLSDSKRESEASVVLLCQENNELKAQSKTLTAQNAKLAELCRQLHKQGDATAAQQ